MLFETSRSAGAFFVQDTDKPSVVLKPRWPCNPSWGVISDKLSRQVMEERKHCTLSRCQWICVAVLRVCLQETLSARTNQKLKIAFPCFCREIFFSVWYICLWCLNLLKVFFPDFTLSNVSALEDHSFFFFFSLSATGVFCLLLRSQVLYAGIKSTWGYCGDTAHFTKCISPVVLSVNPRYVYPRCPVW